MAVTGVHGHHRPSPGAAPAEEDAGAGGGQGAVAAGEAEAQRLEQDLLGAAGSLLAAPRLRLPVFSPDLRTRGQDGRLPAQVAGEQRRERPQQRF